MREVRAPHSSFGPWALGHSVGIVSALFLFAAAFMSWVSSSYNADVLAVQYPIGFSVFDWTIIVGLIQTYVYGYIAGVILATFYNRALR